MKRWSRILAGALEEVQVGDRWLVCNSEGPQGCGSRDDKHLRSSSGKNQDTMTESHIFHISLYSGDLNNEHLNIGNI